MGIPFAKIGSFALRALGAIATGVPAVQAFQRASGTGDAVAKEAAVLALVQGELTTAELALGRDLANDADVIAAARAVIATVKAFYKVLEQKAAGPA